MTTLRFVLRLNAVSCLGFAVLFIAAPGWIGSVLGLRADLLLRFVGLGLALNGLHLLIAARRAVLRRTEVLWFSTGDMTWWLASVGLVAVPGLIPQPMGQLAVLSVGLGVAALGVAQLFALGRTTAPGSAAAHWARLGASWMALPHWVKLWLTALNTVFLAALAYWPEPISVNTMLAYVASGPLLLGGAALQGGLSRALGLAHLLTYAPLLAWLIVQGPSGAYLILLAATLGVCLCLDVWDLWRYARGERAIMGG